MKFEQVLPAFKEGKKITRELWPDYMYLHIDEENSIITYDMLEDDWIILDNLEVLEE